ncbi:single-stranded DNA-binding protein [Bifidobacterium favimelis]|uniref:Single-stranded DNA-binding protein n=1 Tax=Bifidobacterium favimelis TaxID=3122979 RepID=A0ABU8ZM41_9BIFI
MAVNETRVTMFGYAGKDPVPIGLSGNTPICSFRLGSTPAYYDPSKQAWKNRHTTWVTVKAFRALAEHVLRSVHKGDPVLVTGQLITETWIKDGEEHSALTLQADGVGHDLNQGVDVFSRIRRTGDRSDLHPAVVGGPGPDAEGDRDALSPCQGGPLLPVEGDAGAAASGQVRDGPGKENASAMMADAF